MPNFEKINLMINAEDKATKTLKSVLDYLTKIETKLSKINGFKIPKIDLTSEQVKAINNLSKMSEKTKKLALDTKKVGEEIKKTTKYYMVLQGKRPFDYDSGNKSFVGHNLGQQHRLQRKGLEMWQPKQLLLQAPSERTKFLTEQRAKLSAAEQALKEVKDYYSKNNFIELSEDKNVAEYIAKRNARNQELKKATDEKNKIIKEDAKKTVENKKSYLLRNYESELLGVGIEPNMDFKKMNKKQKAYANALLSLENAKLTISTLQERYRNVFNNDYSSSKKSKLANINKAIAKAENSYIKAVSRVQTAKQKMQAQNKYKKLDAYGLGGETPYKTTLNRTDTGELQKVEYYKKQVGDIETIYRAINGQVISISNNLKHSSKNASLLSKVGMKTKKFFKSIGRIVIYRMIRSAMAAIKKAFIDSAQQLAKVDKNFNDTMSKLVTSFDKIKGSFAIIIEPFVEMLEPIIANISEYLVNIANTISYLVAKNKGLTSYTKINSKYAKDYAESLEDANKTLFGFDKFEVLKKGNQSNYFEKKQVDINSQLEGGKNVEEISQILIDITSIVGDAVAILREILNDPYMRSVLSIMLSIIADAVSQIRDVVENISDLVKSIQDFNSRGILQNLLLLIINILEPLAWGSINILKGVLNWIIHGINLLLKPLNLIYNFIARISNKLFGTNLKKDALQIGSLEYTNYDSVTSFSDKVKNYMDGKSFDANSNSARNSFNGAFSGSVGNSITINFEGLNNNNIARELAESMAKQFRKQNIKVSGI